MLISEITSEAVRAAIRECNERGRDRFLEHYGFKRARSYYLLFEGKFDDSKAILGVAHRHQFPGRRRLKPSDFSGGKHTVKPRLESLGFEVVVK
jgi:5-methylcytosine-specific restriction protein A